MATLLIVLGVLLFLAITGIVSARDMRPQSRSPEWSVGRLID